jgi:hypothetical protein
MLALPAGAAVGFCGWANLPARGSCGLRGVSRAMQSPGADDMRSPRARAMGMDLQGWRMRLSGIKDTFTNTTRSLKGRWGSSHREHHQAHAGPHRGDRGGSPPGTPSASSSAGLDNAAQSAAS